MKEFFNLDHLFITILSFAVTGLIVPVMADLSFLSPVAKALENFSLYEMFYEVMSDDVVYDDNIAVVDMGDVDDRARLGDILAEIDSCHPSVIAIDLIFQGDEKSGSMHLLERVADICEREDGTPMVFGYSLRDYDTRRQTFTTSLESFFSFLLPDSYLGYTNIPDCSEGKKLQNIVLDYPTIIDREDCRPLSYRAVQTVNPDITARLEGSELMVDFRPVHFDIVRHDSIMQHRDLLENRIVLLGTCNASEDQKMTLVGRMPGVVFNAYAVRTMLSCSELKHVDAWLAYIISFIMVYLTSYMNFIYTKLHRKTSILSQFFSTSLVMSWILFLWTGFVTWVFFMLFELYRLEFDVTEMLIGILFIMMTSDLYSFIVTQLHKLFPKWDFLSKSLYLDQPSGGDAVALVKSPRLYTKNTVKFKHV